MTVAENIKRIRKERGFTQKQLAEKCGMTESTLRQYEIGYRNPKIETLHKIAKGLGVSIILLVDGCENKYPLTHTDYQIDLYNSMTDEEKEIASQYEKSVTCIVENATTTPHTIAAHFDGDEYTEEELDKIREYAAFVKSQRKAVGTLPKNGKPRKIEQLNAAHAIPGTPEDDQQHDNNIMDDENF